MMFFNNPPFGESAAGDKSGKTDAYAADNHLTTSEALLRGLLSAFRRFRGLSLPRAPFFSSIEFPFLASFVRTHTP